MPYGIIKVDTITFTNAGVDKSVSVSGLVQNPTFTGNVTATGTISGLIVQAPTVTGTTANFASGVYTTQISGAIVKVPAGGAGAPSIQVGVGASVAPGLYGAGTDLLGISTGGAGRIFIDSTGRLGVGTSTPQNKLEVIGDDERMVCRNVTNSGIARIEAQVQDYASGPSFIGTSIVQNGSTTTGTNAGLSNANLGILNFQNTSAGLVITNGEVPLVFATTSTERMRIDGSGRVGIGTSSPGSLFDVRFPTSPTTNNGAGVNTFRVWTSSALAADTGGAISLGGVSAPAGGATSFGQIAGRKVNATSADYAGYLQFSVNNSVGTMFEAMRIDSNGNVAIGTNISSSTHKLEVIGDGNRIVCRNATNGGEARIEAQVQNYTSGSTFIGTSISQYGSTATGTTGGQANANLGVLTFQNTSCGLITTNGGTPLVFATTNTEHLRIDSSGRVGIGTTGPSRKLEVSDTSVDNFIRVNTTGATKSGIEFSNGGSAFGQLYFNNVAPYDLSLLQQYTTGSLILGTNNTERLRIDSNGRVGIGISSPTTLLDVNSDTVRLRTARTPASATATGTAGEICWDANYIYVCTATDTWRRTTLSSW